MPLFCAPVPPWLLPDVLLAGGRACDPELEEVVVLEADATCVVPKPAGIVPIVLCWHSRTPDWIGAWRPAKVAVLLSDSVLHRLSWTAIAIWLLAICLFLAYLLVLRSIGSQIAAGTSTAQF